MKLKYLLVNTANLKD